VSIDDAGPGTGRIAVEGDDRTIGLGLLVTAMVALAVVAVASFVAADGADDPYEAQAALLIDQPQAIAAADGGEVLGKLSNLRLKYTGLVRTRELTEPIADAVGGSPDEIAGKITAVAPSDSLLIVVRARSAQRDDAIALAAAASEALRTYVEEEHEREDIPPGDRFVLREVTPAENAAVVDTSTRRTALQAVAALAALGFLAAPVVYVVQRRRDG